MGRAARTVRGPGLDCRTHKGFEFRSIPRRVCSPTGRFLVCATLYRDVRFLQQVRTSGTTVSFGLCEAEGKPRARATIRGLNRSQQSTRAQPDRIKRGRRVATRYDKFAANYPAIHQARTDSHLVACSWAPRPDTDRVLDHGRGLMASAAGFESQRFPQFGKPAIATGTGSRKVP